MKKFFAFAIAASSLAAHAQLNNEITTNATVNSFQSVLSDFTFNYYVKFLGPSLSNGLQDGATYNRFETGQDYKGDELDFKGSQQTYQSFKLGYRLPKGMIVSYGVTYQDNLRENVEYSSKNLDGSESVYTREYGRSYNNHRVSLWVPNFAGNNIFFMGASVYYEIPTTEGSKDSDMMYGVGVQPSVGFYSNVPGLSYGLGFSLERDVYPDNEFYPNWCKEPGMTCKGVYTIKNQVLRASVSPYLNYMLTDKVTLKSQLSFDWDQDGDQAETLEFNNNMDDVLSMGASYSFNQHVNISAGVEASISNPHIDRTALFGSLGVGI